MLTKVMNLSYSKDRPLSKIEIRSESATRLAIIAILFTMDLTDWMYSDIEKMLILTVCSWYLSCCTLTLEGDAKIHSREHHTSRDMMRPMTWQEQPQ